MNHKLGPVLEFVPHNCGRTYQYTVPHHEKFTLITQYQRGVVQYSQW